MQYKRISSAGVVTLTIIFINIFMPNIMGQEVFFKDNFDKTLSKWKFKTDRLELVNEELIGNFLKSGVALYVGNPEWKNYIFEAKVKIIQRGKGGSHCGFFVRKKVRILFGGIRVISISPGAKQTLLKKMPVNIGEWYNLKCICDGNKITFFLNNEKVGQIDDAPLKGEIGLYVHNAIAAFDDIKVTALEKKRKEKK
jgi:3-keto-disaccharide hydrolase